jgi:hypothetical protein
MSYSVRFDGFKTEQQAIEFIAWYEGIGEQIFADHLDIINMPVEDGCFVKNWGDGELHEGSTLVVKLHTKEKS